VPARRIGRPNLIVIAAGYAGGLAAFPWLPGPYLGPERSLIARAAIAFLIPTAALVTCSVVDTLLGGASSDNLHAESAKAVRAVVLFTALFMVALHGLVLLSLLGFFVAFPAHRLVVVLFGLLLVGIGNVLPRVRPNLIIGIHTRRLLANRTAWARVHRVAGYLLVVFGVTAIGAGLTLSKSQIPLVLSVSVVAGATMNLAVYWRWTRG
jgi:uncharacterized membrane protein